MFYCNMFGGYNILSASICTSTCEAIRKITIIKSCTVMVGFQ